MISVHNFIMSDPVTEAIDFGYPDRPVYVRLADGTLHQIDDVIKSRIITSSGAHDVIVIELGSGEAREE